MQGEDLNRYGELYVQKYPRLKTKVVDGSSLAVAAVLNSIPKAATQVLHRGNISKVASAVVLNLCQRGIQVLLTLSPRPIGAKVVTCFNLTVIYLKLIV